MAPLPIDIISGFLGAGKTTLIQRLLEGPYGSKRIAVVENDFGEVGIDGKLLEAAGSTVTEIVSGCICCTLALDFQKAIETIAADGKMDRIIIEPSGVAKLTDVLRAVRRVSSGSVRFGRVVTVVDKNTFPSYSKGFGAFYLDQVMNADTLLVSKLDTAASESAPAPSAAANRSAAPAGDETARLLREYNPRAEIIAVSWESEVFEGFLLGFDGAGDETGIRDRAAEEGEDHGKVHNHSAEEFSSLSFEIATPATTGSIRRRVRELLEDSDAPGAGEILRIKGLVDTSDQGPVRVDWAGGTLSIEAAGTVPDNKLVVIGRNRLPEPEE